MGIIVDKCKEMNNLRAVFFFKARHEKIKNELETRGEEVQMPGNCLVSLFKMFIFIYTHLFKPLQRLPLKKSSMCVDLTVLKRLKFLI